MSRVVGKKLRDAREAQNLTLEQAESATHIRTRYLQALESGNFGILPSKLQVTGFLRSYGSYLGLNPDALIEAAGRDPWKALEILDDQAESEGDLPGPPEVDSEATFQSIGQTLKIQRESLGLSLEEVAQFTHLRIPYLKAMEAGEIDALPSPVQGRGMLKNYAGFMGLDSDRILLRFADGLQARLVETASIADMKPTQVKPAPARRTGRLLSRDLVVGIIMALSLVVFIVWGAIQVTALRSEGGVEPTAPSIADVLLPSSTSMMLPTPTATLASPLEGNGEAAGVIEGPVVEETQAVVFVSERVEGAVQVQVVARQRAWMRITVDGKVEFDGRIIPGTIYGFAGEEYVEITTGNGAGLQVFYNNQDLGTLGAMGEVVNFVITINGVQTPTPTITLTPTSTSTPEETPTPTP